MRFLLQRVIQASVSVGNREIAAIGKGLVVLVGFTKGDENIDLSAAADKTLNLRVFADVSGRFQYSLADINADLLVVPQFTLYGATGKGRRPDFSQALAPDRATQLFDQLLKTFSEKVFGKLASGRFGADMQVNLTNDGPVTLMLEWQ